MKGIRELQLEQSLAFFKDVLQETLASFPNLAGVIFSRGFMGR
jgi:hypothetical protein